MSVFRVISPGFQTTVQDLGRPRFTHLGISPSGAADPVSLRLGNLLVDNPPGAAALEMTLVGGTFEFSEDTVVALTGSDFGSTLNGVPVSCWRSFLVPMGGILRCGATKSGARCYLCIHGGVDVPPILESMSTHIMTELGGLNGRAVAAGDTLSIRRKRHDSFNHHALEERITTGVLMRDMMRVTRGPQAELFSDEALSLFSTSMYRVTEESNRMGLRLTGPPVKKTETTDMITEGVSMGAVQISNDGEPIILFVEHQTTGGYPKIANVISADLHRLGQLRPRDAVRFEFVSVDQALQFLDDLELLISPTSLRPL